VHPSLDRLLEEMREIGVDLWLDGGELKYRAPPEQMTELMLAKLRVHKPELMNLFANRSWQLAPVYPPLVFQTEKLPLSFQQLRMWEFELDRAYGPADRVIQGALWLQGTIDAGVLQSAIDALMQRHCAFRTWFATIGPTPIQNIASSAPCKVRHVDLSACGSENAARQLRERAQAEMLMPFDLASPPLIRMLLVQIAINQHVLLFTVHHIISDGWSMGIIRREILALYQHARTHGVAPAESTSARYVDYAMAERRMLQGSLLDARIRYWRANLARASPVRLCDARRFVPPTNRAGPFGQLAFSVSSAVFGRLWRLAHTEGVPFNATLIATLAVALSEACQNEDIIIASLEANRTRTHLSGIIGLFSEIILLRILTNKAGSFRDIMKDVHKAILNARAHALPFQILRAHGLTASASSVTVNYLVSDAPTADPRSISADRPIAAMALTLEPPPLLAWTDIYLIFVGSRQGMRGLCWFNSAEYSAIVMSQFLDSYSTVMRLVSMHPTAPLAAVAELCNSHSSRDSTA
jgi:hypothetical protein